MSNGEEHHGLPAGGGLPPGGGGDSQAIDANQLLSAVEQVVGDKLRPLLQQRDETRKRKSDDPSFKFRGNKEQFEFNSEVLTVVRKVGKAVEDVPMDSNRVQDLVNSAKDLLHQRNKIIRMADRSPMGWATVEEYLSDDLADDSDDEKRIRKAEERATRKKNRGSGSRKRPFRGGAPRSSNPRGQFAGNPYEYQASEAGPSTSYQWPPPGWPVPPPFGVFGGQRGAFNGRGKGRGGRGACHGCGDPTHWIKECPALKGGSGPQ